MKDQLTLTLQEDLENVAGCLEYWLERIGEYESEEVSLSNDACVLEDSKKALEFLHSYIEELKQKSTSNDVCILSNCSKHKDEEYDFEEICPHCDYVNEVKWDKKSHTFICKGCGETILLCSLCDMDNHTCGKCPYEEELQKNNALAQ